MSRDFTEYYWGAFGAVLRHRQKIARDPKYAVQAKSFVHAHIEALGEVEEALSYLSDKFPTLDTYYLFSDNSAHTEPEFFDKMIAQKGSTCVSANAFNELMSIDYRLHGAGLMAWFREALGVTNIYPCVGTTSNGDAVAYSKGHKDLVYLAVKL